MTLFSSSDRSWIADSMAERLKEQIEKGGFCDFLKEVAE